MPEFYSWGHLSPSHSLLLSPASRGTQEVDALLRSLPAGMSYLPRGNARSNGDACQNDGGALLSSLCLDHLISFDPQGLTVTCESGVLLRDLQRFLVPRGFMLPVTPGTQLVTVGGAIASDVHCKNHHLYGTFGCNVKAFTLHRSDGEVLECTPKRNVGFFRATIGGQGLTGFISRATLSLRRVPGPFLSAEEIPFGSLEEFYALCRDSVGNFEHTVSWTDAIRGNGQHGIYMRSSHAPAPSFKRPPRELEVAVPLMAPLSLIRPLTLRTFNLAYYQLHAARKRPFCAHYENFFYPLDAVHDWNRIFGPAGFYQYQYAIPPQYAAAATAEVQKQIARAGQGSFLSVLKTFGPKRSPGMLSFPQEGTTYAVDLPNRGEETRKLLSKLDAIVLEAKGRIYMAKDAHQSRALFEQGYGEAMQEFLKYVDPRCSSGLSRRLMDI